MNINIKILFLKEFENREYSIVSFGLTSIPSFHFNPGCPAFYRFASARVHGAEQRIRTRSSFHVTTYGNDIVLESRLLCRRRCRGD